MVQFIGCKYFTLCSRYDVHTSLNDLTVDTSMTTAYSCNINLYGFCYTMLALWVFFHLGCKKSVLLQEIQKDTASSNSMPVAYNTTLPMPTIPISN